MLIYDYNPHLQEKRCHKNYRRVHDVFVGRLSIELKGNVNQHMSKEAKQLVSSYGSYFIHFPQFTFVRVGVFESEPMKLPRYALDQFVLIEICRLLGHIDKKTVGKKDSRVSFPVDLGHYICKTLSDELNLEIYFKKLNLKYYVPR